MRTPHPDFPVIDAHVHLYPDALAQKAVPMLSERFGNAPAFDGTVAGCAADAAEAGVMLSVNLPVATTPDHVGHTNAFWSRYASKGYDGKSPVISLAALHPQTPDAADEVCNVARMGFAGIKFHPEYQGFRFNDAAMDEFTSPEEAAEFVKATGVCCLAVLIGNAHGHYKKPPKLDIERVKAIRKATGGIPLVLHGGSGIPDEEVKAAIAAGIRKMNIGTDVCCAFASGTLASLQDPSRSIAVDVFMKPAVAAVRALAEEKIELVGAVGRA